MALARPLFVPVILGTPRKGRMSEPVARFVMNELSKFPAIAPELIDVRTVRVDVDDAGEDLKDPRFSDVCNRADAFILVTPEYNHGYPGLLKHILDTNLKEYIHKAAGIVGVSAGPFGGTRVVENLLPVMRELGLVTIFWSVNFQRVQKAFDDSGNLLEPVYVKQFEKFVKELIWMATVLRYGRENISID